MKAYVITTGSVFGLLVLAHLLRVFEEPHLVRDPFFVFVTLAATALCLWSWRVLRPGPGG
jgi:hypothetical protein